MSIAVYVPISLGGYGDLLFGLKVVHELKKSLRKQGYHNPIYLVTRDEEKKQILTLEGHSEFNIKIKSVDEFNQSKDAKNLDYLIQGPVFSGKTWGEIKIPNTTPILLISEYSLLYTENYKKEEKCLRSKHSNIRAIQSGFDTAADSCESGYGILFSEELSQVAEDKRGDRFDSCEKYWANLEKYASWLLQGKSIENYHKSTELSFEYSHNTRYLRHVYDPKSNTCARYLHIHQLLNENSNKNQDIFSIGKNRKGEGDQKKAALIELLPTLKKNGFNKIMYINLELGNKEILYYDPQLPQKTYQLFHAQQATHKEIIALQALSGPLAGVTGDQSFGEALSSEKLIVYECISYKKKLAEEFIKTFKTLDLDNEKKASRLAELLIKAQVTSNQDEVNELRKLIQNSTIVKEYQTICRKIQKDYNLGKNIISIISDEINLAIHSQKNNNTSGISSTDPVYATDNQENKNSLLGNMLIFGLITLLKKNIPSSNLTNTPSCSRFF